MQRVCHRLLLAGAALALTLHLSSCGGGVGSGGTGSPVQATGSGIVTGFGSVYVDGVRYDDSEASVMTEVAPGRFVNASLALGQSVELALSAEGVAASITIEPRLTAPVEAVEAGGVLRVLGRTVRLNSDPAAGPVTAFGDGAEMPGVGDVVEVHGFTLGDGTLQATRLERLAEAPAQARIAGRIDALDAAAPQQRFTLDGVVIDASTAQREPAGVTLREGQSVVVFGSRPDGGTLRATRLRVLEHLSTPAVEAQLAGRVESLAASTMRVGGVEVDFGDAEILPAGRALADGQYVRVRGEYVADDRLAARSVVIQGGGPPVEMAGTLFDVDPGTASARLRDTRVATGGATLQDCAGGLSNGRYVELRGRIEADVVVAEAIRCQVDEPGGATVERRGVAGPFEATDDVGNDDGRSQRTRPGRFVLTPPDGAPITVRIERRTHLRDVTESELGGASVRVEGRFRDGVLEARSVTRL